MSGGSDRFDKRAVSFLNLLSGREVAFAAAYSMVAHKASLLIVLRMKSVAPAAAARAIAVGLSKAVNAITWHFGQISRSGLISETPSSPP